MQWQESSDGSSFSDIAGATATNYSFIATADKNGYQYRAIFSNSCGAATSMAAALTVNPDPIVDIVVIATSEVYTGGDASIIYLGYGAQSVELQASGGEQYAWSPSMGLSDATMADPVFTPTQEGVYPFTVTVTNGEGCQAKASVTITVIDVRCGNKNDKVEVCHKGSSKCIAAPNVEDHLAHGDNLGACNTTASSTARYSSVHEDKYADEHEDKLAVQPLLRSYPNAFTETTTIEFSFTQDEAYSLTIYDSYGRVVEHLQQEKQKLENSFS